MHGLAACQGGAGCPQRIVRSGNEDFVAVVEKGVHGKLDKLACAIASVDVLHAHIGDALDLGILHDSLSGVENAAGFRVALRIHNGIAHVEDDFLGSGETEGGGVAYVQFQNLHALLFHAGRFVNDRAAHIIEHMIELAGFAKRPHCPSAPGQAPSPVLVEVEKKTKKRVVRTYGSMRACLLVHMFCCIGPKKLSCQGHTCLLDVRGLGKRACGRSAPVRSEEVFLFLLWFLHFLGKFFAERVVSRSQIPVL